MTEEELARLDVLVPPTSRVRVSVQELRDGFTEWFYGDRPPLEVTRYGEPVALLLFVGRREKEVADATE